MCGIAGIVNTGRSASKSGLLAMCDALAHRGPDDAGVWESPSGKALLGSRRLAILDLSSSGHQPMQDESGNVAVAFNGEIYNYLELARELETHGCRFRSHSDTEVLLKSYQIWGRDCLRRLNGMFAFAIWDERRGKLFAARDRFGEKPFYFVQNSDPVPFAFASEIKALVAGGFVSPRPRQTAVYRYLVNREIDAGTETLFENIFSLPAAHALFYSPNEGSLEIFRYWDLDPGNEIRLSSPEQYAERFLELLLDSVRIRLRSDVPVGSSLSGGLDSSTIVGIIAKTQAALSQESFSARFRDPKLDEGMYIEQMTTWANVKSNFTYPEPEGIPEEIEQLTWHQDAPFYSASIYAQWCVMRLAKERGVTVLLDGQGGDEVLAGYHEYFASYYIHLLKSLRLKRAFWEMYGYWIEHGRGFVPQIVAEALPQRWRSAAKGWLSPRGLRPEFRSKWNRPPSAPARKYDNELQQCLYATLTHSVLPQLLRYADRNSMAFSREVRLPFLDYRLVEFLYAIPSEQKLRGTQTKVILRNAISGIVPEAIRLRKDKLGFAPPEAAWLRGPLCHWIQEVFASREFRQREWWEPRTVDSVWSRFQKGEESLHTAIWRWLSLEVWARTCLADKPRIQSRTASAVDSGQSNVPHTGTSNVAPHFGGS
jgi:asparagine synthase (glutamine-hydrolysing)